MPLMAELDVETGSTIDSRKTKKTLPVRLEWTFDKQQLIILQLDNLILNYAVLV